MSTVRNIVPAFGLLVNTGIPWRTGSPELPLIARHLIAASASLGHSHPFLVFSPAVFQRRAPASTLDEERQRSVGESSTEPSALFTKLITLSRSQAWEIVGGLSNPSKMPCYAWGIPAITCQIGAKLAAVASSVCAKCYALKGHYRRPKVNAAYQRRLYRFDNPQWIDAMVKLVYWQSAETGEPYFRWFDSGDLQSIEMLREIATVSKLTPEIQHWLPTREYAILRAYLRHEQPPANLIIRVSAPLVDGPAPQSFGLPTSGVHHQGEVEGLACRASEQKPANCGDCRACWDHGVEHVSYPLH